MTNGATLTYDLAVIGSGPGGYVAAIHAAHLGMSVAVVEKDSKLGGTCGLRGCIPTKSLLHAADLLQEARQAKAHGVLAGEVGFDFDAIQTQRSKVVTKSAAGVAYLMKHNGIAVHHGHARLVGTHGGTHGVAVDAGASGTVRLDAKFVILATGSRPKSLPFLTVDGVVVVTSDELLTVTRPPKSLLVLGAGAVGVEFASAFSRFGSHCTVVEMLDRLLPLEDEEISREFEKAFRKRGVTCHTSTRVVSAEVRDGHVVAKIANADTTTSVDAEMLLVAVGRAPVTDDLGLDGVGIKRDAGGFVEVDTFCRTAVPTIYAIGDIIATPQLAHTASAEAALAIDHMAGREARPINYRHNPGATYCDPEVASVGLSEKAAKEAGYTVKVGRFPFAASAKARILGANEGLVKIVADARYDEILGVHILGPQATDLIAEACLALRLECTATELAHTIHPHPSLSEAMGEAAHAALGKALHL